MKLKFLKTTIPLQRIDAKIILSEVGKLFEKAKETSRLKIHTGYPLNSENNLKSIKKNFDAVFLGFGLSASMGLPGASSHPDGIEDAISFLKRMKVKSDLTIGEKVAVLGGGNTAIDAAVVAKENGARDVYIVYRRSFNELPAWPKERDLALEKGIHFLILSQPLDYVEENGKLIGLKAARTDLGEPDESGRRKPVVIEKSEFRDRENDNEYGFFFIL